MTSLVQSAIVSYFILTVGASVGEREVFGSAKCFFKLTPVIEFFSLSFFRVCKTINSMQEFLVESTMFAHE